jgi:predicted transcriptional regulator
MGKLTVQLSGELDSVLDDLAKSQGIPKTQVIRRSIALMKYLNEETSESDRKLAITENGKVVTEIVTK